MILADKNQSTAELLLRVKNGDMEAKEELVKQNLALVKYIVKRFLGRGYEFEDLFQNGCIGLIKAIERFDTSYGVAFSTYAVPVIMGEIRRFLRDDGPVHVARSIHDNAVKIQRFSEKILRETGQEPQLDDISKSLNIPREDALLAINSVRRPRYFSEPVGKDSDMLLMDALGKEVIPAVDMRLTICKMLRDLSGEERSLIIDRYFASRTQTDIAREMGISQVQVSRMESRILKKLRAMVAEQ